MGGTDMERHRRGWKETRLSKQRLVEFIAGRRRGDLTPSPSFYLYLSFSLRSLFVYYPILSSYLRRSSPPSTACDRRTSRTRSTAARSLASSASSSVTYLDIKAR